MVPVDLVWTLSFPAPAPAPAGARWTVAARGRTARPRPPPVEALLVRGVGPGGGRPPSLRGYESATKGDRWGGGGIGARHGARARDGSAAIAPSRSKSAPTARPCGAAAN